jgi:hypothetical protein
MRWVSINFSYEKNTNKLFRYSIILRLVYIKYAGS